MKIWFWSSSKDGSSWYRAEQPAAALSWNGHETNVSQHTVDTKADVVIASRLAQPGPSDLWAKMSTDPDGPRLVLDLDDDYFDIEPSNTHAYDFWNRPGMLERLRENMLLADVITVASEGLAAAVDAQLPLSRPPIEVVPNGLHAGYLSEPRNYEPDVITLGWSGSDATATDFPMIERALNLALDTFPNVRVRTVGLGPRYTIKRERVESAGFLQPVEAYLAAVSTFDIWLAPYSDNRFNNAKFPTKALEAGVLGIPLIASSITPYRDWFSGVEYHAANIDQPHQWSRCLRAMIERPHIRRQMGEHGRARAARNVLQATVFAWEKVCSGD